MKLFSTIVLIGTFVVAQAQTITSVVPAVGKVGTTLEVVISGDQTHFGQGTAVLNTSVWLSQVKSNTDPNIIFPTGIKSTNSIDLDKMTVTFDFDAKEPVGLYHVNVVTGPDGLITLNSGFNLNDSPVGLDETRETYEMSVYPNPTLNELNLKMNLQKSAKVVVNIYDMNGKQLFFSKEAQASSGPFLMNLNAEVTDLLSGIYIMQVFVDDAVMVQPIVKQ